jgi:hypothetical protein
MTNQVIVIVRLDRWKLIRIPESIQFDYFSYDGYNWWWNEEKKLLIDHYNILRKTDKDSFLHFYKQYPAIYHMVSQQIAMNKFVEFDTFNNWYAATKVY